MLGDLDLGLHLVRSQALRDGEPLSAVTARLARAAGLATRLLPATDDRLRTHLVTPQGTFAFQEWFVARGHEDEVDALVYEGADTSRPAPGVLDALAAADAIVIAPSNPFVSIHPILAVPGIRAALEARSVRSVAVSPLIGGRAVRGPARPHDAAARRRDDPGACDKVLQGLARRARDRPRRRAVPNGGRRARGHRYAHQRPRRRPPARPDDSGGSNGGSSREDRPDRRHRELRDGARRPAARGRLRGRDRLARRRARPGRRGGARCRGRDERGCRAGSRPRRADDEGGRRRRDGPVAARRDRHDAGALRRGRAVRSRRTASSRRPRRPRSRSGSRT